MGSIAGYAVGYAAKKLFKLALFIAGLFILLVAYLNCSGMGVFKVEHVLGWAEGALGALASTLAGLLDFLVGNVGFGAGFVGGLLLGIKSG